MNTLSTRRRVVCTAPDVIEVREEVEPELLAGEVLVRMLVSGVCGSDKAGAHGDHAFFKPPYYPGHEAVGEIVALGPGVDGPGAGTWVTVEPTLICGECKMCRTERENLCENLEFFGCGFREGGMADVFAVKSSRLHLVPDSFTAFQAALIEPLATPIHAVRLAGDLQGKAVVVQGSGTIGLLVMAAARRAGAKTIIATDPVQSKRDLALQLGADHVLDSTSPDLADQARTLLGESVDVVFDCVSIQPTIDAAVRMVVKGGTVVIVGGARRPVTVDLPLIQEFQIKLQGTTTYRAEDFREAIDMIAAGNVRSEDFITATFPVAEAAKAFEAIATGQEVKILVVAEDLADRDHGQSRGAAGAAGTAV